MRLKKSPSQARAQETVERIMEAAATVMMQNGVTSLTIRKVAVEAGLGVGSIYDYFSNKQILLEAVCEKRLQKRLELFEAKLLATTGSNLYEELTSYRKAVEKADLTSQLGPALRHASEQNPGLRKIVKSYETKLTNGLSAFLKKHAPHLPVAKRDALATYLMHIDYMTMSLMHHSSDTENAYFQSMQAAVKQKLLEIAGIGPNKPAPVSVKKSIL